MIQELKKHIDEYVRHDMRLNHADLIQRLNKIDRQLKYITEKVSDIEMNQRKHEVRHPRAASGPGEKLPVYGPGRE